MDNWVLLGEFGVGSEETPSEELGSWSFLGIFTAGGDLDTALSEILTYETFYLSPIETVRLVNGGSGYELPPTLSTASYFDPEIRQEVLDLGIIADVQVLNGGAGYDPETDKIYVDEIQGYGAEFTFEVDGFGTITSVTITSSGEGYNTSNGDPIKMFIANKDDASAPSAGSGAIIRGLKYGEGEIYDVSVDSVGRIIDLKLLSRGSGYVEVPEVSLRIKDVVISNIGEGISSFSEGLEVYQGSNVESSTFYAKVESYEPSTSKLRIYDFTGNINQSFSLKVNDDPLYNVGIVSITSYGNGLARANAEFSNGTINYNGFYLNTDGFLSADKRLQDDKKYHNFSYVIIAERGLNEYRNALLDILHPSGMKVLGYNEIYSMNDKSIEPSSNVYAYNVYTGTVTIDPFDETNLLTGTLTEFEQFEVGDLISFGTGNRIVVKEITDIINDYDIELESSTKYFGEGKLQITQDSNTFTIVSNNYPIVIEPSDIIQYNLNSTLINSEVLLVSGDEITVNTESSSIDSTANVYYMVYPYYEDVEYRVITNANRE